MTAATHGKAPARLQPGEGTSGQSARASAPIVQGPVVYGCLRVDLTRHTGHNLVRALQRVCEAPARARIEIVVGRGQYPPIGTCDYVRDEGRHLASFCVISDDVEALYAWTSALTGGWAA